MLAISPGRAGAREVSVDLLVVGGSESGVAAAVQGARQGIRTIALVNDIEWLGGQFSAEGVGAVDEWTLYRSRRVNFPRSGIFLEVMRRIREYDGSRYGVSSPGNSVTATDTIEPAAAARIFAQLLEPYKQVSVFSWYEPVRVERQGSRVAAVEFAGTRDARDRLIVRARMTIDASDWGDVIRLSGARYGAGPDVKSRFHEENAPEGPLGEDCNEMNPITYCAVLRETGKPSVIARPAGYDERAYLGTNKLTKPEFAKLQWPARVWSSDAPLFVDTDYPEGTYSGNSSIYTHRRLVDRYHNHLAPGTETVLLNWPVQDYPTWNLPQAVRDALEATERGASGKNLVDMTPAQRRIVFEDARRHTLGFVYFLQTTASRLAGDYPQTFRNMALVDDFGTPDHMPPKIYVREGLRLEALYMMKEQDIKARSNEQSEGLQKFGELGWAQVMPPDNIFGFQFNLDFHPTRRVFLEGPSGPWMCTATANRNWSMHTDRAGFPLRSLVPVELDGLWGAGKNLGVSSIVSSAVRLHGQTMMVGQAAATAAAICLRENIQPRALARDWALIRELQSRLVRSTEQHPGVILWPYHDVSPDDRYFEAANLLAVRGILPGDPGSLDFEPWRTVTRAELQRAVARAYRDVSGSTMPRAAAPAEPTAPADWRMLYDLLHAAGWNPSQGLIASDRRLTGGSPLLNRQDLAFHLWSAIRDRKENFPTCAGYLQPGNDCDSDGIPDLEDGLPFDRNNDGIPDWVEEKTAVHPHKRP